MNLDSVESVSIATLTDRLGRLSDERMGEVCSALSIAVNCRPQNSVSTSAVRCRSRDAGTFGASVEIGRREAQGVGRRSEALVSGDDHEVPVGDHLHCGQMDRVMNAKSVIFGELTGSGGQGSGELNVVELPVQRLQLNNGRLELA